MPFFSRPQSSGLPEHGGQRGFVLAKLSLDPSDIAWVHPDDLYELVFGNVIGQLMVSFDPTTYLLTMQRTDNNFQPLTSTISAHMWVYHDDAYHLFSFELLTDQEGFAYHDLSGLEEWFVPGSSFWIDIYDWTHGAGGYWSFDHYFGD
jgi:hypothetical protein